MDINSLTDSACSICGVVKPLCVINPLHKHFIMDVISKVNPLNSEEKRILTELRSELDLICRKCNIKLYNFYSFIKMCRNRLYELKEMEIDDDSKNNVKDLSNNDCKEEGEENDEKRENQSCSIGVDDSKSGCQLADQKDVVADQKDVVADQKKVVDEAKSNKIIEWEYDRHIKEEVILEDADLVVLEEMIVKNRIEEKCEKLESYDRDYITNDDFDDEDIKPLTARANHTNKSRGKWQCKDCDIDFKTLKSLQNHAILHNKEKKCHTCSMCTRTFKTVTSLRNHERTHSADRSFQCQACDKIFTCATSLMRHEMHHRKDGTMSKLTAHKAKCEVCNGEFAANYMEVHMKRHTGDKQFLCAECPKQFHTKSLLREHLKSHQEKQHLCTICGKKFGRADHLKIHLKRHSGVKPHKCSFCGKGFARYADLAVHTLYHTDDKRHICHWCGKGFHRPYNLKVHQRIHTGERPYKCEHCPKSFAQCYDLTTHVRRRHTGEKYTCDLCDVGFYQKYYLTRHKLKEHGIQSNSSGRVKKINEKLDESYELKHEKCEEKVDNSEKFKT